MSAPAACAGPRPRPSTPSSEIPTAIAEPERQRLAVPAEDDQRAHSLEQVGDRVDGRDRAEPVRSISSRGSALEDRNTSTKNSGNTPWTASPEPVRSPISAPERRRTPARSAAPARASRARRRRPPRSAARPRSRPPGRCTADISATAITPASLPSSSAARRIGVSARRLRNPVSMSRARLEPALIEANSAPWMNGNASAKFR